MPVDVIIPIYGNIGITERCISSVLDHKDQVIDKLIVIDDASPDRDTRDYLDSLASKNAISLLRNDKNQGFVYSVNLAASITNGDFIILNSDTEVPRTWASRLLCYLDRESRIATVTPLTNSGTICTYPWLDWKGGIPGELTLDMMDSIVQSVADGVLHIIPTAIGFCTLIRKQCWDELQGFDFYLFGKGYGEETDFSQRAIKKGWINVAAIDTYVYHRGGASFGSDSDILKNNAQKILDKVHPEYAKSVKDFILKDSLGKVRSRIDVGRVMLDKDQIGYIVEERTQEKNWILGWLSHVAG